MKWNIGKTGCGGDNEDPPCNTYWSQNIPLNMHNIQYCECTYMYE